MRRLTEHDGYIAAIRMHVCYIRGIVLNVHYAGNYHVLMSRWYYCSSYEHVNISV